MKFVVALLFATLALASPALAQSTAFTYQGKLKNGSLPANGLHDFRFSLFDAQSGGSQVGTTQCVDDIVVTDGVFSATIDFGQQFASGAPRFLQIDVRADTGLDCANQTGFTTLAQRQAISPTPLANHAKSAFSLDAPDGSPANAVFVDNDGKVGVGTTTPAALLHVKGAAEGIRVEGPSGDSTNQAYVSFVDSAGTRRGYIGDGSTGDNAIILASDTGDVVLNSAAGRVVNVTPTGNVGIGTTAPAATLDVHGDIRLGSSGQLRAPGGEENLRIIRGTIGINGNVIRGSGFTSSRISDGDYLITFNTAFTGIPTVTATADDNEDQISFFHYYVAGIYNPTTTSVRIRTRGHSSSGIPTGRIDEPFHFIAVGPR